MEATHPAASPHETAGIRPPRATRRPVFSVPRIAFSIVAIAAFEVALVVLLPRLLELYAAALRLLDAGAVTTQEFFRGELPVMELNIWVPGPTVLVGIMAAAGVGAVAVAYAGSWNPMLRGILIAEAMLIGGAAMFMLATGRPPYAGDAFASLYAETSVLTWLVLPLLLGVASLSVPFRAWERLSMLLLVLMFGVVLSVVRYGFFAEALDAGSSVLMAPLFLNFGPLLDFIGGIAIFSAMLVRVSSRLERGDPRRVWSWS